MLLYLKDDPAAGGINRVTILDNLPMLVAMGIIKPHGVVRIAVSPLHTLFSVFLLAILSMLVIIAIETSEARRLKHLPSTALSTPVLLSLFSTFVAKLVWHLPQNVHQLVRQAPRNTIM